MRIRRHEKTIMLGTLMGEEKKNGYIHPLSTVTSCEQIL
jgi:hypothetical protein